MERLLFLGVFACLAGIAVIFHTAVRQRNAPAVVNTGVSFLLVFVPVLVDVLTHWFYGIRVGLSPELPLWIAVTGLFHSYGMLGPYDEISWWDHLTHTLSAALVAALLYAGVIVALEYAPVAAGTGLIWVTVVLVTLLSGVFWEVIELLARDFGRRCNLPPVLEHYGRRDTVLDLFFDVVGAVLVLAADLRLFVPMAEVSPKTTVAALVVVLGGLVVGSLVTSLIVVVAQAESKPRTDSGRSD
ncbi:hypothetical protein [Halopenitus persicus]|uniref:Uncharacterized protein n=1 Tax=Halopenitus persicus TaxID=1048396 RepID=A0A1H3IS31_9EURY|nr:hypothetical protein [Halopenitus persicus]QHS17252.1 hypothetical protein GWK26_08910 [haloarchaeon 3A1-DGR]SDY30522.1 hypothetical protein SAMN05216564_104241 [Halopenitus persicus]